jgi:hypothetical protein
METREHALTHLSLQRSLDIVEQALRQSGAVIQHRESHRVLASKRTSGASSDAEIEVEVEPCYCWSRIVIVGRWRAMTAKDQGQDALDLRSLVESVKRIEDDLFPEGWQPFGELRIHSGTLLLADPTNFSDPVKIEGIPPALYSLYCQRETANMEFRTPILRRIRLRIRPGPIEARWKSGTARLLFPGAAHYTRAFDGIAVLIDGCYYEEHWGEASHREQLIRELTRYPGSWEAVVRDHFGATALLIHADSIIDLREQVEAYSDLDGLDLSSTEEPTDNSDDVRTVTAFRLCGSGELRGIEFRL